MYKDADIIAHLEESLGSQAAQMTTARLLRVPQAWEALRDPAFLSECLDASGGLPVFPSFLAARALGVAELSEALSSEERSAFLADGAEFLITAKQALELCRIEQTAGSAEVVDFMLGASPEWRSAFICAWPEFSDHAAILNAIVEANDPDLGGSAASALLAYMSAQQAADELMAIDSGLAFRVLPLVMDEPELHTALQEELAELAELFQVSQDASVDRSSHEAIVLSQLGRTQDAHNAVQKAWELATGQTALVADRLAAIAREERDLVLEAEARQQALEAHPTPERRSECAMSLMSIERYEEALSFVREGQSFEEKVAAGSIYLAIKDTHNAGRLLNQAAQESGHVGTCSAEWLQLLAEGLEGIGFHVQAIKVYEDLIAQYPARSGLRASIANLLHSIGDHQRAVEHAYIAVTLNPDDDSSRELLAKSFEQNGEKTKALPHWEILADKNIEMNLQYGECALSAGAPDLAQDAAGRILSAEPDHVGALVLSGRALSEAGQHAEAKTILSDVTERSPDDARAWIALAASLQAMQEGEIAGQTLSDALRANPDHPELHIARAAWLKESERPSEALEHTRKATMAVPDNTKWLLLQAELLGTLGQYDEACQNLEAVLAAEPANWNAAEMLARTYEQLGEVEKAIDLVTSAPEKISPDSAYYIGRLLADAGSSTSDFEQANAHLSAAKRGGLEDPTIDYWIGVVEQKQLKHQPAAKHFLRYLEGVKDAGAERYLDAVVRFAKSALEIGETTMALTQLEKAKPSFPTSIELLSILSEAQFASGDALKSLDAAREAAELYPESVQAMQVFKQAAERAGELDEAIDAQRLLTAWAPDDPANWLALTRIEERRGEADAARDTLAKAVYLGRNQADICSEAAECAQILDRPGLGIRLLKRATKLDGENKAYFVKLAQTAERVNDVQTAADAWLECASRDPKDPSALVPAAKSLWKLGRRTAALGLLQQATTVAPDNGIAHFELGQSLIFMNDTARGLNELATAVSIDPNNSVMRSRAASLMAKYSSPQEGIALLNGSTPAGKFPEFAEAKAECRWLTGDAQGAKAALESIPSAVPLSAKGQALRSLIKLNEGDLQAAVEVYEQIRSEDVESIMEWDWVFRAGMAIGNWEFIQSRIEYLESGNLIAPEVLLVAFQSLIQVEHMDWITASLANASSHSDRGQSKASLTESIKSKLQRTALPESVIATVESLYALHSGDLRAETFEVDEDQVGFDPSFVDQCLSIALLRANRPTKAIERLERLPTEPFNRSFSSLILGLAHVSAEQFTAAERAFREAAEFMTTKPLAHYFEARMWEKSGANEKAITAFNDAVSLRPDEPHWHMELALLYSADDQGSAALPHLQQAAELAPEDAQILVELARAYRSNGQLSDAEEVYARSLQANPTSPKVWKEAGQVALDSGVNDRAEAWFERACSLLPGDAGCLMGSARSAQRLGKSKEALERARKAYSLAPDDPQVLSGLGDILAENGALEKAIQVYDKALRLSEHDAGVRLSRSKLLLQAGRPKESIADLEQLVQANPEHHESWATLAKVFAASNEFDAGLQAVQQAVSIAPRNLDYRILMAKLCRQSGQLDQALDILTGLEAEAPDRVEIAREKGMVHEERRELELAIDAYNRALAIDSHDADTVVKAGLLLKQLKAYEESAVLLERGTELRPQDADLHQQLAAVRALQFVHGQRIDEQVVAS